jgi:hypothetical protein
VHALGNSSDPHHWAPSSPTTTASAALLSAESQRCNASTCLENLNAGRCLPCERADEYMVGTSSDAAEEHARGPRVVRKGHHTLTGHQLPTIALTTDVASGRLFTSSADCTIQVRGQASPWLNELGRVPCTSLRFGSLDLAVATVTSA